MSMARISCASTASPVASSALRSSGPLIESRSTKVTRLVEGDPPGERAGRSYRCAPLARRASTPHLHNLHTCATRPRGAPGSGPVTGFVPARRRWVSFSFPHTAHVLKGGPMRRFAVLAGVVMLATGSLVAATANFAGAGAATSVFDDPGDNDTPANTYVVPAGVCQVTIDAIGADGGAGASEVQESYEVGEN